MSKRFRASVVGDSLGGEDGDFVQLRIEREKRRKNSESSEPKKRSSRGNSLIPTTLEKGFSALRQPKKINTEKEDNTKLQKKLFKAIEEKNLDRFNAKRAKHGSGVDPSTIRDPKTDLNVLHYALEVNSMDIANHLIQEGNTKLICSNHLVHHAGCEGRRNILHILIQKGNKEVIEIVLDKITDVEEEKEMLLMETVVRIEGQRPKPLPCFHIAAFYGQTNLLELFLERTEMDIDQLNSKNETALMWASRQGHVETVEALVKRGANVNIKSDKGSNALYLAVRYGHVDVARVLLTTGKADPQATRKLGLVSPLIVACAFGNAEMVNLLLRQPSVDVNLRIRGGETALHYATREGCTDIVRKLLDNGAAADTPDEFGDTPLLLAVKNGHVEMTNIFIDKGANIEQRNHEGHDIWQYAIDRDEDYLLEAIVISTQEMLGLGRQPLCVAADLGYSDKVEFLVRMGLDPQTTDKEGNTFLHRAAMQDHYDIIKRFSNQELLDVQNKNGNTALHIACYRGFDASVKTLIELKANPGIKNNKGETVLHAAAFSKTINAETVNKLVEFTIKSYSWDVLNVKDYQGNNCLHIAAKHAMPDIIWEFRNVSIKDQDKDGMTPLHEAVRPNEPEALDIMLDIFELARRDARMNEQTFITRETVLHFAVKECHTECVERLIQLGADISERDYNGNTVLHRVVMSCVQDSQNKLQHLEVFDVVLAGIVTWWCMKNNVGIPYESDTEAIMKYREEAIHYVSQTLLNKDGMSVCDLAFTLGCSEILSNLLMMQNVTYFLREDDDTCTHIFDISGLMPRTKKIKQPKESDKKKQSSSEITFLPEQKTNKSKKLTGMEWLITCKDSIKTGEILDIPPIEMIERHYTSLVAWVFTLILILHIGYMGVFTYVGIEVQRRLRKDNFSMTLTDLSRSDAGVLYFLVPLEPVIIFLIMIFTFVRYCFTGDIKRRIQLGKTKSVLTVLSVIQAYVAPAIYFLFAVLVITWIVLLRLEYKYQDYVLAFAICMGWLLAISFTRGIKAVHFFYKMLISIILRDVVRFLFVYMFILLAVSLAVHVLFEVSDEIIEMYQTTGATVFMFFNVMTGMGELFDDAIDDGFQSTGRNTDYLRAFYLLYIVLGTVVMLNLLIAMMNDSYIKVLRDKSTDWRIDSIKIGMEIERTLPICRVFSPVSIRYGYLGSRRTKRWYVTLTDSDMDEYYQLLERKANKPDALTKRIEVIEQRTLAIEKIMTLKLQQITDALGTKKKKKAWYKRLNILGKKDASPIEEDDEYNDAKSVKSPSDKSSPY